MGPTVGYTWQTLRDVKISGGKMYWTDSSATLIMRSNLDGSEVEELYDTTSGPSPTLDYPYGIAIDEETGYLYVAEYGQNLIWRGSIDGTEPLTTVWYVGASTNPFGLALHDGVLYWTEAQNDRIQKANADGSGVITTVLTTGQSPNFITVVPEEQKIYWSDSGAGGVGDLDTISKANLD